MEKEVLISRKSDEWERINSVTSGQLSQGREEATPFIVFGKLLKWESSVRKQIFSVCELSQEIFLQLSALFFDVWNVHHPPVVLYSDAHRDKDKAFWFCLFVCFGCTGSISCMAISLFETSGGYSLLAGCMASHCGGFFCCGAPALGTWASVVSL